MQSSRAAEWCEREMGLQVDRHGEWRSKLGERDLGLVVELTPSRAVALGMDRQEGATLDRRDAVRRTHYSWVEVLRREAAPAACLAAERESARWEDVHAALRGYGVRLEGAGSGARVVGPERGQRVKASDVGLKISELAEQLGPFEPELKSERSWEHRTRLAQAALASARSWETLHNELGTVGLAVAKTAHGGRLLDLEGGPSRAARPGVSELW